MATVWPPDELKIIALRDLENPRPFDPVEVLEIWNKRHFVFARDKIGKFWEVAAWHGDKDAIFAVRFFRDASNVGRGVHGGAIASVIDAVEGISCIINGRSVVTGERHIRYLNPCTIRVPYLMKAKVTPPTSGSRRVFVEVTVQDFAGKVYVKANTTMVLMKIPLPPSTSKL
eukprot:jgi/Bigna1/75945/fgenesh1_pg.38_\